MSSRPTATPPQEGRRGPGVGPPGYQPKPMKPFRTASEIERGKLPEGITESMMVHPK